VDSIASPTLHFFNVAVADPLRAIEVARLAAKAPQDASARVIRSLSSGEIAAIQLRDGQAKPA
jgi:hypothetical protein